MFQKEDIKKQDLTPGNNEMKKLKMKKATLTIIVIGYIGLLIILFFISDWQVKNKEKKQSLNKYQHLNRYNQEIYCKQIGIKWGYVNREGKIVINPKFDNAEDFSEDMARVKIGNKWGLIDKTGNMVISPQQFDEVGVCHNGMVKVRTGIKWGYVNREGKIVINPKFDNAEDFSEDMTGVKIGNKWGFIDKTGNMLINPQFDNVGRFHLMIAAVWIDGKKERNYIDKTGHILGSWEYYNKSEDYILYYDPRSITNTSKNILRVWLKLVYTQKGREKLFTERKISEARRRALFEVLGSELSYTLVIEEINCERNISHSLSFIDFESSTSGDYPIDYEDSYDSHFPTHTNNNKWRFTIPKSINEPLYKTICK